MAQKWGKIDFHISRKVQNLQIDITKSFKNEINFQKIKKTF